MSVLKKLKIAKSKKKIFLNDMKIIKKIFYLTIHSRMKCHMPYSANHLTSFQFASTC